MTTHLQAPHTHPAPPTHPGQEGTVPSGRPGGLHRIALYLAVLSLTAAAFHDGLLASLSTQLRIPLAALLFLTSLRWPDDSRRRLVDVPPLARSLMFWGWVFTAVSAVLVPFSIAPAQAAPQLAVLGLLVATMHVHVVRRWHDPAMIEADIRVVFWALGTTIIPSVFIGGAVTQRSSGLFDNPNTLALAALFTFCLGLGLAKKGLASLPVLATMLASLGAILLTETRTAIVALGAALAVVLLKQLTRKSRIPLPVIGAVWVACCTLCASLLMRGRLPLPAVSERFVASDLGSLNTRNLAWEYAIDLWSMRPLGGYGFRLGELAFEQNRSLTAFTRDGTHNSYLQTLLEVGIAGMIPFSLMLLATIAVIARCPARGHSIGLVALLVAGLISATTESFMLGVGLSMSWTFWLTAAAAACLASSSPSRTEDGDVPTARPQGT